MSTHVAEEAGNSDRAVNERPSNDRPMQGLEPVTV